MTHTFAALHKLPVVDAQPFRQALEQLQQLWDEQDRLAEEDQRRRAMQFMEDRQALAGQIALTIQQRADLDQMPAPVLDFLRGPWARVLAHARLTTPAGQTDAEGFEALVGDLLWSVNPQVALQRPARLITMIPALLDTLHAGLATLAPEVPETGDFFAALETLHQPALKLRRQRSQRSQRDVEDSGSAPLLDESGDAAVLPDAPSAREPGVQASLPEEFPMALHRAEIADQDLPEAEELAQTLEATGPVDLQQTLLSLHEGSWVDLYSKHSWQRAQLVWADQRGTLFMFVSHGGQPHSMTKRSCERLIKEGLLRLAPSHESMADTLEGGGKEVAPGTKALSGFKGNYHRAGQNRFQPLRSEPRTHEESKL